MLVQRLDAGQRTVAAPRIVEADGVHIGEDEVLAVPLAAHHHLTVRIENVAVAVTLSVRRPDALRLADDDEITAIFCDCEWGVVSPFGPLYGVPTLLDESLPPDAVLLFEAHSHGLAIRMSCRDFETLFRPRRLRLARPRVRG